MLDDGLKTLTLNNSPYIDQSWYYGTLSRDEAEKYLKVYGTDKGDFLIRDSERRVCLMFLWRPYHFFSCFLGRKLFVEHPR